MKAVLGYAAHRVQPGAAALRKTGTQQESGVEMGPLISARQLPHIEITAGGSTLGSQGFFYQPRVVAGALQGDEIVRSEVFGPVLSITRAKDAEQAAAWANDSD